MARFPVYSFLPMFTIALFCRNVKLFASFPRSNRLMEQGWHDGVRYDAKFINDFFFDNGLCLLFYYRTIKIFYYQQNAYLLIYLSKKP